MYILGIFKEMRIAVCFFFQLIWRSMNLRKRIYLICYVKKYFLLDTISHRYKLTDNYFDIYRDEYYSNNYATVR